MQAFYVINNTHIHIYIYIYLNVYELRKIHIVKFTNTIYIYIVIYIVYNINYYVTRAQGLMAHLNGLFRSHRHVPNSALSAISTGRTGRSGLVGSAGTETLEGAAFPTI